MTRMLQEFILKLLVSLFENQKDFFFKMDTCLTTILVINTSLKLLHVLFSHLKQIDKHQTLSSTDASRIPSL